MTITKYRTDHRYSDIKPVKIVRETDRTVFFGANTSGIEVRERKVSAYRRYHDTWEAAHAFLLDRADMALRRARLALQSAQGEYGNIKGMKPPGAAK